MSETFCIGDTPIGPGHPCWIVAEIAQAHDGSLGTAHAYIDAAAQAGANAVKFQTHIAAAESTPGEPWRVKFSQQDDSRYDYWKRMEFTPQQWAGLKTHAEEKGLTFLSSPFSLEAVELLQDLGVQAWKFGAGETTSRDLLKKAAQNGAPILLSSGMSTWEELDLAVQTVREAGVPCAVYQCTSAYPCPPEKTGLNLLHELRDRYACPVGLSDHSGTVFAGLGAVTLGANLLEVHLTFSRQSFGPDVPASLTVEELTELVQGVRWLEKALAHPVDKQAMAEDLTPLRGLFQKSAYFLHNLPAGHTLTSADMGLRKPGGGLNAEEAEALIGGVLRHSVEAFSQVTSDSVEI